MATYYVGSGGNDSNDGLSWANRFLSLNGAEDEPVAAGDTVYVAPGTYREQLTCDVSGSSGSPITYIADVTGANTDGVGGEVRITGSDDDQTRTRSYGIYATEKDYRTFRGFTFDSCSTALMRAISCENWIVEDCFFRNSGIGLFYDGASQATLTARRCIFQSGKDTSYVMYINSGPSDANHVIENCLFIGGYNALYMNSLGGIDVKNVTFIGGGTLCRHNGSGYTASTIANSILMGCGGIALQASSSGQLTEDYNAIVFNNVARSNVATGSNSNTYTAVMEANPLLAGYRLHQPYVTGALSDSSPLNAIADDGSAPTDDLYGMMRPTYNGRRSWGAVQWPGWALDTGTKRSGSYAIKWAGGAGYYVMTVPVSASTSTTISCYVYRESGYVATSTFLPRMIIREPGQSDRVTTDTGDAAQWNQLTDTWTTQSTTTAVQVIIECDNNSGTDYAVWVDDIEVS